MADGQRGDVLQHVRKLLDAQSLEQLTDGELLERFLSRKEEAAFAVLVRRHGPMVLGVCRRLLHDWHDAEDAFQATFLVLARKAAALRGRESAAGWLYRVAYHLALKARASACRRQTHERQAAVKANPDPLDDIRLSEAQALLEKYPGDATDAYMTLVGYFNSLRELGGTRRLVEDDVQSRIYGRRIEERGFKPRGRLEVEELTSRRSAEEIPRILDKLGLSRRAEVPERVHIEDDADPVAENPQTQSRRNDGHADQTPDCVHRRKPNLRPHLCHLSTHARPIGRQPSV